MNAVSFHLHDPSAAMRARIEELEAENAYLRSELGLAFDAGKVAALKRYWRPMSPGMAAILLALHAAVGRTLTRWQLDDAMPHHDHTVDRDGNHVSVQVYNIRRALGPDVIMSVRGRGYSLTDHGAGLIDRALASAERRVV